MESIIRFMGKRFTVDFSIYDESFLERTISNRMMDSSCNTTKEYLIYLDKMPGEGALLIDSLTNSYSEYFRNPLTFALLKQYIFPKIFKEKARVNAHEIRIWSAGCAAGQEAYSLAMLAHDFIEGHHFATSFRIFATDICKKQLEEARNGIYEQKTLHNTNLAYVNTYFTNNGKVYAINENLKKYIDFSYYDLLDEETMAPPASIFGGFDIIMCSNVLFYYKTDTQRMILNKLSRSLNEGGVLITDDAEIAIVTADRNFRQFAAPTSVFIKV